MKMLGRESGVKTVAFTCTFSEGEGERVERWDEAERELKKKIQQILIGY